MTELIVVSFATFIGWQMLRSLAWFEIPGRLTTFIVFAIAYLMTLMSRPSALIALAATGGCALLFRFIAVDSISPLSIPWGSLLAWSGIRRVRAFRPASRSSVNLDKIRIPRL